MCVKIKLITFKKTVCILSLYEHKLRVNWVDPEKILRESIRVASGISPTLNLRSNPNPK